MNVECSGDNICFCKSQHVQLDRPLSLSLSLSSYYIATSRKLKNTYHPYDYITSPAACHWPSWSSSS